MRSTRSMRPVSLNVLYMSPRGSVALKKRGKFNCIAIEVVAQLHSASPPKPPTSVLLVGLGLHQFIYMDCLSV